MRRINIYYLFAAFLLLLGSGGSVMSQVVNIRLELPAGVSHETRTIKTNLPSQGEEIVWIEIVADENLTFLIRGSQEDSAIMNKMPIYFLNDGSDDFGKAIKCMGSDYFTLQIHPVGLLMRNFKLPFRRLKAWIGLPNTKNVIYSIEYP